MTYRELINKVFDDYYYSNLLPSTYGGFEGSTAVQLLSAINVLHDGNKKNTDINKVWYDDQTVTWYTSQLHKLIHLPRFSDDTDQDFLNRVKSFQDAQEFGGQSESSIVTVLVGLMSEAIQPINIAFYYQEDTSDIWDGSADWDGTAAWQDIDTVLDVDFLVSITFTRSGWPTDKYAWEYWVSEMNISKIAELINLFKPVGTTYKIELIAPPSLRRYRYSDIRIKVLDNSQQETSSTRIMILDNEDTLISQTAIFTAGYFYGDLENYQTLNIHSESNIKKGVDQGNLNLHTYTKLYGSFTTIVAP